ncbi:splicing factor-like protein 1 [Forsythia ovata]|uniref:Splicing factor-like protein 1 n=1 Tax=Forsythia ovata TaxID=205694 RepID=A0ABD1VLC1_9LAMI
MRGLQFRGDLQYLFLMHPTIPPPGSTMYIPVPGQLAPHYTVQYPPLMPLASSGVPGQTVSSSNTDTQQTYASFVETQENHLPIVQSHGSGPFQYAPTYMYGSMPPNAHAAYPTHPYSYPSYYSGLSICRVWKR